jgi:enolase
VILIFLKTASISEPEIEPDRKLGRVSIPKEITMTNIDHSSTQSFQIDALSVRSILNSQGSLSIEAEVSSAGTRGIGSAPRAIVPGRREKRLTADANLGNMNQHPSVQTLKSYLTSRGFSSQTQFDEIFESEGEFEDIGTDISLAVSLAVCRAQSKLYHRPFYKNLSNLANCSPSMPRPIINVFSGGVHGRKVPFQQLMIVPQYETIRENIDVGIRIYSNIEKHMKSRDLLEGYSSSSGMLPKVTNLFELFDIISNEIERLGVQRSVALGTDVAAEHLEVGPQLYRLNASHGVVSLQDLLELHKTLLDSYNFAFFEDPFGPADEAAWRNLTAYAGECTTVVGDDLFATNADNIESGLASGILLKMNQIGTVTGTLRAAEKACEFGMQICVSHRSKETEDTAMCDLAYGIGADMIKIGGPRRGDRIAKYNQLLRLSEST